MRILLVLLSGAILKSTGLKNIYVFDDEKSQIHQPTIGLPKGSDSFLYSKIKTSMESNFLNFILREAVANPDFLLNMIFLDIRDYPSTNVCHLANAFDIPYIIYTASHMPNCAAMRVRLSTTDFVEAALVAFKHEKGNIDEVTILLDETASFDLNVLERGNNSNLYVRMIQISEDSEFLDALVTDSETQMVLVMGSDIARHVFTKLQGYVTAMRDQWAVAVMNSYDCPIANMTNFEYICFRHEGSDTNKTIKQQAFKKMVEIVGSLDVSSSVLHQSVNHFKELEKEGGTNDSLKTIVLRQVCLTGEEHAEEEVGVWTRKSGLRIKSGSSLYGPIPEPVLRVVTVHEPPFVIQIQTGNQTIYTGYAFDVLDEICIRLGIKYKAIEVPDKQYGIKQSDGSWTGIIGNVAKGMSDLGVGPISVTAERETVIDFSAPYYDYAGLQILMKDSTKPKSLFIFASVFTEIVWILWFITIIMTALLLFGYHRLRDYIASKYGQTGTDGKFNLMNSFWFVMASFTQAGPDRSPMTFSSRILVAGFWFFCHIMMATYTANLAAFMTSSRLHTPIESLEDLAIQSGIRYSALAGSVSEIYFKRMANIENNFYSLWKEMSYYSTSQSTISKYAVWDYPLGDRYTRILSAINTTGFVNTSSLGIQMVMEGNFAYVHETPLIKYEMSKTCGLMTVGAAFSAKPYAFVLPEKSPLADQFSSVILELQSELILEKLKEKWWRSKNPTCSETTDENTGLTLESLGGIFIVILGGCFLSYVVLGAELIVNKIRLPRKGSASESKITTEEPTTSKENDKPSVDTRKEDPLDISSITSDFNFTLEKNISQLDLLY